MIRVITFLLIYVICFINSFGQVTAEEIVIKNNQIELPGTLSYTQKNSPLLIWVHGSGNVDRNGNQAPLVKANYIQQFRNAVNQHHLAFFSYDKRTANPKNNEYLKGTLFEDFVADTKKVVSYFKDNHQFSELILVGHSQGSLVAMLASEKATKYVSLAGPANTIDSLIVKQLKKQAPFLETALNAHFKELKETDTIKEVNPLFMSILSPENLPFIKSWMHYNPSEEIKKITLPTLIINGTKDLQVAVEDAELLHKANPNATLVVINNMNHVLKHITKNEDNQNSYLSPDYPVSEKLIKSIVNFAKQ
ncbi:alpha/beta hydrolase [Tenacibaculum tangerinum]|uniref:Alpha/beta hydrolase n=1 Tax=Tenacibaculum tangerinum TaxID=3038772 RepID=A0ABY8L6A3_9FLAO|nr:alpha/beta hydrolase [Tenacibaculum tangerinum]WGH76806.1 alpha/beta hydrolase [Tenacibaculum tangerinum]